MKKNIFIAALALVSITATAEQTLNVWTSNVRWAFPASDVGEMQYADGTSLTVMGKTFAVADIDSITVNDDAVVEGNILVTYSGETATVAVAGNIASTITAGVEGAHVTVNQDATVATEYVYTLQGTSANGSFYTDGSYKITLALNGLTLHNPSDAAINVRNGKRIAVELVSGTTNTLSDGTGGAQKGCFAVKGHTEFKGGGTLNITGNTAHAFWGKEYVEVKKTVGAINILGAVKDGFNINQYYLQSGGTVTIQGTGDDGLQVSYETDDDDVIIEDVENTGSITLAGGTLRIIMTADGGKALKAEGNIDTSGGTLDIVQSGNIVVDGSDISYPTSVKAGGNINITGGTVTIENTAAGGKGLNADGDININESNATTVIDVKANGKGGTAETGSSSTGETAKSYKLYVSLPQNGGGGGGRPGSGGSAWSKVYLYKSDGTLVQQLTSSVTKSSGVSSATFYYYDFGSATSDTYYFKADNYTSGGGWGGGTTYTIRSIEVSGPTDGTDVYYTITNSYTTSGSTRTYQVTNVTGTYGGTSDTSEDTGTGYNAGGIKADGNVTIAGGTVTVANSGAMSKSIKSKATVSVTGGDITLTPSGAMMVINSDAGYSSGVKALDFVQSGGSLTINSSGMAGKGISVNNDMTVSGGILKVTNTGAGQYVGSARYTAKGLKADRNMSLTGGTITVATTQNGAKAIKVNGAYTQGTSDGSGPTLTLSTQGSRFTNGTSTGGGGWGGGMGGKTTGQGGAAKGLKAEGTVTILGGTTEVSTKADGGEGIESKTSVTISGGQHYLACYDDCIGSNGNIYFNGGVTVCWSNGNDAVDSNSGRSGAITIGDGAVMAYSTRGGAEEGFDCDNNSYIQITGKGIAISAGGSQGGGWGGSSSISNAAQGYYLSTSSLSFSAGRYYVLGDSSGKNLVTFSFPSTVSSSLSLFTATGMVKGSSYNVRWLTSAPTDATTAFHGVYLGSSTTASSSNQLTSFTAQ